MKAAGPFTRMLWDNILPVYEEITGCPFVTRLLGINTFFQKVNIFN